MRPGRITDRLEAPLNEREAAQFLSIEPRTLRLWRRTRGVPYFSPSKRTILFSRAELLAWLAWISTERN